MFLLGKSKNSQHYPTCNKLIDWNKFKRSRYGQITVVIMKKDIHDQSIAPTKGTAFDRTSAEETALASAANEATRYYQMNLELPDNLRTKFKLNGRYFFNHDYLYLLMVNLLLFLITTLGESHHKRADAMIALYRFAFKAITWPDNFDFKINKNDAKGRANAFLQTYDGSNPPWVDIDLLQYFGFGQQQQQQQQQQQYQGGGQDIAEDLNSMKILSTVELLDPHSGTSSTERIGTWMEKTVKELETELRSLTSDRQLQIVCKQKCGIAGRFPVGTCFVLKKFVLNTKKPYVVVAKLVEDLSVKEWTSLPLKSFEEEDPPIEEEDSVDPDLEE